MSFISRRFHFDGTHFIAIGNKEVDFVVMLSAFGLESIIKVLAIVDLPTRRAP